MHPLPKRENKGSDKQSTHMTPKQKRSRGVPLLPSTNQTNSRKNNGRNTAITTNRHTNHVKVFYF